LASWQLSLAPVCTENLSRIDWPKESPNVSAMIALLCFVLTVLAAPFKSKTGSGKTTVMATLMAWQIVNAVRSPTSSLFSRGFLIVTPGITIRDRLRVLLPDDPDNYYRTRELVPADIQRPGHVTALSTPRVSMRLGFIQRAG
jgi:hypothetical protein